MLLVHRGICSDIDKIISGTGQPVFVHNMAVESFHRELQT